MRQRATIRPIGRALWAVVVAVTALGVLVPAASARDSSVRITLTLRGEVDEDVGFGLAVGGIFYDMFCEFQALRDENGRLAPLCRSNVPYTITLTVAEGEQLPYDISKVSLRSARILWDETLEGDGLDHTRRYVYLFDLPATDTLDAPGPAPIRSAPAAIARRPS